MAVLGRKSTVILGSRSRAERNCADNDEYPLISPLIREGFRSAERVNGFETTEAWKFYAAASGRLM
jgi:hypothetical protein